MKSSIEISCAYAMVRILGVNHCYTLLSALACMELWSSELSFKDDSKCRLERFISYSGKKKEKLKRGKILQRVTKDAFPETQSGRFSWWASKASEQRIWSIKLTYSSVCVNGNSVVCASCYRSQDFRDFRSFVAIWARLFFFSRQNVWFMLISHQVCALFQLSCDVLTSLDCR